MELAFHLFFNARPLGFQYIFEGVRPGVFRNVGDRYWTYQPDRAFRRTLIVVKEDRRETVYSYETDITGLGTIDTGDSSTAGLNIFIGDSFTEGQGSVPWISSADFGPSINFGLMGTGPQNWLSTLKDHLPYVHKAEHLHVLFISDDFGRDRYLIHPNTLECTMGGKCSPKELYFFRSSGTGTDADGVPGHLDKDKIDYPSTQLKRDDIFAGVNFFSRVLRQQLVEYGLRDLSKLEYKNIEVLRKISELKPSRTSFYHIPDKGEVLNGEVRRVAKQSIHALESSGIRVKQLLDQCKFELGDYYEDDPHLNPKGYLKLKNCVLNAMRY